MVTYAKISPKMEDPRDIAGEEEEEKEHKQRRSPLPLSHCAKVSSLSCKTKKVE